MTATVANLEVGANRTAGRPVKGGMIIRDVAFGMRLLRRAPGFSATAALIVALGIGTTTAIFSVVYGVMLRPLPYPEHDRLVALWSRLPNASLLARVNPADQRELRAASSVFEDVALASVPQNFNLIGAGEPERVIAARLSANLLSVLRVNPALGRGFTEDEERSTARVVLLGHGLWRRRFAADPSIVGRTINLSGTPHEVVGVMPPAFQFPDREYQLWIPVSINPRVLSRTIAAHDHFAVGRLRAGVSIEQARREIDNLSVRFQADHPATNRDVRIEVFPLIEESIRAVRPALQAILAAVACLLLIGALNLAGLLGTRAAARAQEFRLRLALGASRGRLVLQALTEVAPVLVIGGIAGVLGARLAIAAFVPLAPAALPRVDQVEVNAPVLAFSMVILILTGLVAGVLPAMQAWRANVVTGQVGSRATGTLRQRHIRAALVIAQVALTLPLLVGATALARSFSALMHVNPGFRAENVLSLQMAIPRTKYRTDEAIAAFYRRIVDGIAALPQVGAVGMVNRLPMAGNNLVLAFEFEGRGDAPLLLQTRSVTPDYFRTMDIPLREGRVVSEHDTARAPVVGVIDDQLARSLWPGESAAGRRFRVSLPGQAPTWGEIVGVVGNVRHGGLESADDRQVYFSYHQFTDGRTALVVRGQNDTRVNAAAVAQAIRAIDPEQPVYDVRTMEDVLGRSTAQRWLNTVLIVVFAMSALALAGVGLYGMLAYGVTQRVREFGVRIALGAMPSEITRAVLLNGSKLTLCGAVLGFGGAVVLVLAMDSLLFNTAPVDPVNFVVAAAVLFGVALIASYVPARRAARTDPVRALRAD